MHHSPNSKVALITGSGKRRVGNVVAETLARRGYAVAVHYRRSAEEARETVARLEQLGTNARAFQADVADEAEVEGLFRQTLDHFGRIDVLVTAAAVWESKPLEEITAEDVRRQFEINALGTFLCCRRAGLIMVGQPEGGSIVTIGDWATARPYPNYAAYFVGKGAIPTITRTMAIELARRNPRVRVNCILPGPVMVPEDLSEADVKGAVAGTLLKRVGRPENVAQAVLSLIENDFVTGVCLPVDGGRMIG
ncbi:MAG TPA: SDR family oxidoreductase [Thermoguttaceae bacterium]|nr:SDR family oxidoreductase [Thermoguttaceae bacterium]